MVVSSEYINSLYRYSCARIALFTFSDHFGAYFRQKRMRTNLCSLLRDVQSASFQLLSLD